MSAWGIILDGVSLTKETIEKIFQMKSLLVADSFCLDLLLYISNNCSDTSVSIAAMELYSAMRGDVNEQIKYVTSHLKDKALEVPLEAFEIFIDRFTFARIIRAGFEGGVVISNLVFHTGDTEECIDVMKVAAHIGETIGNYFSSTLSNFMTYEDSRKEELAKTLVKSFDLLVQGRIYGEKAYEEMLVSIRMGNASNYRISRNIRAILEKVSVCLNEDQEDDVLLCVVSVACPVDVLIYTNDNKLVLTLEDGKEVSDLRNDFLANVFYNPMNDDYEKVIVFTNYNKYKLEIKGKEMGLVDIAKGVVEDNASLDYERVVGIPVTNSSLFEIDDIESSIVKERTQDSTVKEYKMVKDEQSFIEAKNIEVSNAECTVRIGEKKQILARVIPENATIREVSWSSMDESIAAVNNDGVITGLSKGSTNIIASIPEETMRVQIALNVVEEYDEQKQYMITYDTVGGSMESKKQIVSENNPIGILPIPVKNDYVFEGWYTDAVGGVPINKGYVPTEDMTIYAHWKKGDVQAEKKESTSNQTNGGVSASKENKSSVYIPILEKNLVGKIITAKVFKARYKVLNNNTVEYKQIKRKNTKKVIIPNAIRYNGKQYKVVQISDNVFKNNKSTKSVYIGRNIKRIGKNVFYGCKKLKLISLNGNVLKTVKKNAFKGISEKAIVIVRAKNKKKYKSVVRKLKKVGGKKLIYKYQKGK